MRDQYVRAVDFGAVEEYREFVCDVLGCAFAAMITFAMFSGAVYCAWNAFDAADVRQTVLWSAGALVAMLAVAMLKMYFWMEMNKNVTLREVKRLELQVARLASRG